MNAEYLQIEKPKALWHDIIRMLQSFGFSNSKIAKMMNRDESCISRYLGNAGDKSMPVEMPPNGGVSGNLQNSLLKEIERLSEKGQKEKAGKLSKILNELNTLVDWADEIDCEKAEAEQKLYKRSLAINKELLHPKIFPKDAAVCLTLAWPTQDYMNFFIERRIYQNDGFALDKIGKKNESPKSRLFFIREANRQLDVLHEFGITDEMLELMPENLQDLESYLRQMIGNYLSMQLEKNGFCKGFSLNNFVLFLSHIEENESGCGMFYPNDIVDQDRRQNLFGAKKAAGRYEKIDLRDADSVKWRFCLQYAKQFVQELWEVPDLVDKSLEFTRDKENDTLIRVSLSPYGKWIKKYIQELSDKKI